MPQLDKTDLELLIILQEKPTANDLTLAKLVNLSSPTVKRRIDRLYKIGAIERIQGLLNYPALGLTIISVFITVAYHNINSLKDNLQSHKYIYYIIRCIGKSNGIHATFRIPESSLRHTEELFQRLSEEGLIIDYKVYVHKNKEIRSRPRFLVYNSSENSWDFNFSRWIEISAEQLERGVEKSESKITEHISDLDSLDMEILSILSLNSRIKNVEILNQISSVITAQRLSDRLRYLKKNFVTNYRVYLNWKAIFAFMGLLFDCEANKRQKNYFSALLQVNPPPFESIYRETEGGFLLYLICPPDHVYPAIDALFKTCQSVSVYLLNYESSIRSSLNYGTFDNGKKQWKEYIPD